MSGRRKSTINVNRAVRADREGVDSAALELERLEQETTLVLQDIDHNLSQANAVIIDKMFPVMKKYASATRKVWQNVAFWKQFMEEAADVEVRTSDDVLGPHKDGGGRVQEKTQRAEKSSDVQVGEQGAVEDSSDSLAQIQASTPQQARSRASLVPSDATPKFPSHRSSAQYRRVHNLSDKSTPSRLQSGTEARRSSLIRHLNSSPTFPEPPVLMSEVGRANTGSSSSAVKPPPVLRGLSSSDSDSSDLGRLSPVFLPTLTLTPIPSKREAPQERSVQRFPNTPVFGSSASRRGADRSTLASPVQRDRGSARESFQDEPDIPMPQTAIITAHGVDDSDEIAIPQLRSLRRRSSKQENSEKETATKRRKVSGADDEENVFLDSSNTSRNHSTLYHTMAQAHEPAKVVESSSKSISQIFESAEFAGASTHPSRIADRIVEKSQANATTPQTNAQREPAISTEPVEKSKKGNTEPTEGDLTGHTGNLSHTTHSFEHMNNTSEMDSFSKEKWRAFSSNLKK